MDPQFTITWVVRVVIALGLAVIFTLPVLRLRKKIKRLERENQRLNDLASRDGLTEVRSRGWFQKNYPRFVERANGRMLPLGLIMADINNFKKVNDTYGHPAGDAVIRHVAKMIEVACRPTDVVARYGGEEFIVILPGAPPFVVRRICQVAEETTRNTPITLDDGTVLHVTVSFGGISRMGPDINGSKLVKWADDRLLRAKKMKESGAPTVVADSARQPAPIDVVTSDQDETSSHPHLPSA